MSMSRFGKTSLCRLLSQPLFVCPLGMWGIRLLHAANSGASARRCHCIARCDAGEQRARIRQQQLRIRPVQPAYTTKSHRERVYFPTSIALALEIVENGAENNTLTAMAQTLHLPGMAPADVDTANAALQASLVNPDPKVQINIANSLWIQQGRAQVTPAFVQANTTYYGSNVGNLAGAPANVNAWVSSATNGKITSILPPGDYSQDVFVVVNAVYFKGQWTTTFDPAETVNAPFTLLSGTTVTCPMMNQTSSYGYYRGTNFQLATLPYGSGRMSMIVVLPDQGTSWQSFLTTVTAQNLNTWLSQTSTALGSIGLPRFQSSYGANLIPALSTLGMQVAFTSQADFSGIAPSTFLNFVQHKTFLQVDETGTTAAGITGIGGATSVAPTPGFTMTMNHPFFCAIRDDKTGALLFMGSILDPTATASK